MADQEFNKRAAVERLDGVLAEVRRLGGTLSSIDSEYRNYRLREDSDLDRALSDINNTLRNLRDSVERVRGRLN